MHLSSLITVLGGLSKGLGVCMVMDRNKEGKIGWDKHKQSMHMSMDMNKHMNMNMQMHMHMHINVNVDIQEPMPPSGVGPKPQQNLLATIGVALYNRLIKTKTKNWT